MPCYSPLQGYRSVETTDKGKRLFVSDSRRGYAALPLTVPCGQCIGCRLERSRQWAIRLTHEAQLHTEKCFVTLTYDDDHLPPGGTLVKAHFQSFMKRLRKRFPDRPIRFFHCGEYGETTWRPHYHAIIFGLEFLQDRKQYTKNQQGHITYTSQTLDDLWGMGKCQIGGFSFDSAAYVARYVVKKVNGDKAVSHYRRLDPDTGEIFDLLPEYVTMSLKPGIGSAWFDKFKSDVFPRDQVVIRGKAMQPPRRYTILLEKADPRAHQLLKWSRQAKASRHRAEQSTRRLVVREEVKQAQIRTLKRKL
jgi:hypothetical protein